uniref:Uncharacterized protein n=1 Tax=Chinchilla lanigera TaxID=34839 RepID=A0A8C2YSK1_CHILA
MFRLLLLGLVTVLFMDEGDGLGEQWIRYCHSCKHYDGYKCRGGMNTCWKFNLWLENKSCSTENFYFSDVNTGRYLFRYTVLSCKPCVGGVAQVYHDLMKEVFCCTNDDYCNDGSANLD